MTYKSLYRKYRPINFDSMCGQEQIIEILKNSIKSDKIGHAYLFTGTRGTGKTTTAKIFARMVNCLNKKDDIPCGECEICKCENTDEITDIIEIDAASNNGVDEIRELRNKIKLVPSICKYKVYIIDEVHMLSIGAFNALLKTLEEPPDHVIFILATTDPQKLPITVISRCQRFDFKKISESEIIKRLNYIKEQEHISIDEDAIKEIAAMSDGAMRDSIGLLEQLSTFKKNIITKDDIYILNGSISKEKLIILVNYYIDNDYEKMMKMIDDIYIDGKNFLLLSNDILYLFREMLIFKKAKKYFNEKNDIFKEKIIEMSNKLTENQIIKIIENLEKTISAIKTSNYPRILFEIFMLSNYKDNDNNNDDNNSVKILSNNSKTNKNIENKKTLDKEIKIKNHDQLIINNDKNIDENVDQVIISESEKEKNINNTIFGATTNDKKKIQKIIDEIDKYLIDEKYAKAAGILKDSIVVAASSDHVILTYKYNGIVLDNDCELNNIEYIFEHELNKKYKVVGILDKYWNEIRPKYLELAKNNKLKYIEENKKINVENDFMNIIEEE